MLCSMHPEKPFDFAEKAYWLQRDVALKAFVDQWLHISRGGRQLQENLCGLVRLIPGWTSLFSQEIDRRSGAILTAWIRLPKWIAK